MLIVAFKNEEELRDGLYCAVEGRNGTCNVRHYRRFDRVIKRFKKALQEKLEREKPMNFRLDDMVSK